MITLGRPGQMLGAKAGWYLDTSQRERGSVIKENGWEVADEGDETGDRLQWDLPIPNWRLHIILPCACVCTKSFHSCLTLCDPMDCSPPGSSVQGILQASILEWIAMPSSRGSSRPRDWACGFCGSYIAGRRFTAEPRGKPLLPCSWYLPGVSVNRVAVFTNGISLEHR